MQNLWIIITLLLMSLFTQSKAQTSYDAEMEKAISEFQQSETLVDFDKTAQHFDQIAQSNPDNWLPVYYSMFMKTLAAFQMEPKQALKTSDRLDDQFQKLESLNPNESEALILRALYRTVKVAKDPQRYGMTLPSAIIRDYNEALRLEPENPRATYLMAQFNMESAPYWGKDPKQYCPQIEQAKQLFLKEEKSDFEPNWGEDRTDEILNNLCKK